MESNFDLEVVTKILQQLISLHVRIQTLSLSGKNQKGSEKVDENSVHDRVAVDSRIDVGVAVAKYPKKLHDKVFELQIAEKRRVIILIEDELEGLVVDDLLYFVDVGLVVDVVQLEAEFQVLIIEDADVGLRVIVEAFDHASWVYEVVVEKLRQRLGLGEQSLVIVARELLQRFHDS